MHTLYEHIITLKRIHFFSINNNERTRMCVRACFVLIANRYTRMYVCT